MKHGDITHPGDEFNNDDMAYCAFCGTSHTVAFKGCDGLRRPASALAVQEGGGHYKGLKIQPIEYIHANNIPFAEGCAIKYLTRWRDKGGIADLEKAKHFIELLIELEKKND